MAEIGQKVLNFNTIYVTVIVTVPFSRSAFFYNPALQSRSFLMLGVISTHASNHVITRSLKVMEEVRISLHSSQISYFLFLVPDNSKS